MDLHGSTFVLAGRRLIRRLIRGVLLRGPVRAAFDWISALLVAAFLASLLLCWAPGAGIDESEMDAGRRADSVAALRQERAQDRSVFHVYGSLLRGLASGELGHSSALNRPVAELLAERLPVTAALTASGLTLAWAAGLLLALAGLPSQALRWLPLGLISLLVAVPVAVIALACTLAGWPAALAMAAAVLPKVFSYADQIFQRGLGEPYRVMAKARGIGPGRLLAAHLLWPAWPELRALAAVTVPVALGAAIPVEVFTDTPGLGQLAWKAASGRDVMLLLYLTVMLTGLTLLCGRNRPEVGRG